MPETFTSGIAGIEVDQDAMRARLDQVSDGAVSNFINAAQATLEPIKVGAVARWPVASGLSRDSFTIWTTIRGSKLRVGLSNSATNKGFPYPLRLKWSVYEERSVRENLAERARVVAKGKDPAAQKALGRWWDRNRRLTSSKDGAPSATVAGKKPWNRLVRTPGKRQAVKLVEQVQADLARLAKGS